MKRIILKQTENNYYIGRNKVSQDKFSQILFATASEAEFVPYLDKQGKQVNKWIVIY